MPNIPQSGLSCSVCRCRSHQVRRGGETALITQRLHHLDGVAVLDPGAPGGFGRREAIVDEPGLGLFEMEAELALEVAITGRLAQGAPAAAHPLAQVSHDMKSALTIDTMRSHPCFSASRCARPAGVMS